MKSKENLVVNIVTHAILAVMSAAAILPFLLLIVSSFTAQDEILLHGYSLFPRQFSLEAYNYLWRQRSQIFNAYGITILVTAFGTVLNVVITTLLAYPLSRSDLPGGRFLTFLVFFTMLFNGGLVPTYLIYTIYFGIKNTFAALLVPSLLMSPWYVLLSKSFFVNNVPGAVLESARIDGAHEFLIYQKIVMPVSKPIVATVALFAGIAYWNDWYNAMLFLDEGSRNLYPLQYFLNNILTKAQAMNAAAARSGIPASDVPSEPMKLAMTVVATGPIILLYPFLQKYFVKGVTIGAVKG